MKYKTDERAAPSSKSAASKTNGQNHTTVRPFRANTPLPDRPRPFGMLVGELIERAARAAGAAS